MARLHTRKFRRVYWDSCIWISLIQNETAVPLRNGQIENRAALARTVLDDATKRVADIFTSTIAFSEVNRPSGVPSDIAGTPDKLAAFFENDFIVPVMLDRHIGERARALMQGGYAGLKPLDAVHLASALVANVDEMHSFDDKLLNLNERLQKKDGTPLKICKPAMGGPPLPLLDSPPATLAEPTDEGDEDAATP